MTTMTEAERPELSGRALRDAFAQFPSGVVAVAATIDGKPVGMAISAFAPVSLDPPLGGIFVANTSSTWQVLRTAPTLGVSILGGEHDRLAKRLSGPAEHRVDEVPFSTGDRGAVVIDGTPLALEVTVESESPAGDHTLVLLRIRSVEVRPEHSTLLFHRSILSGLATIDAADR